MDADLERDLVADIESLVEHGPRSRAALIRLADRGDWRARVLAVSAIGRLVRDDSSARRRSSVLGRVLARVPGLRRHLPTVGEKGRLVSRSLLNAAVGRSFVIRTAAALALGECRDPALVPALERMLADPFQPVRLAAAAAIVVSGRRAVVLGKQESAEVTPERMAEGVSTMDWLRRLAAAHSALLSDAAPQLNQPLQATAEERASWLAGPLEASGTGGASAEAARYEREADLSYQLAKPFGAEDRADNLRQLDAFVALAANLGLPRGARVVDLGGGSGWVGELLARFGLRPIVVDVAPALLRLARRRFADAGLNGLAVAGDMTALPLRTASVGAVVAIDALHHVEDLAAVLAETRRVLVPGGRFLIGEPGEGHSESPKARAESREHGVREGEIHSLAVAHLAARAGFDRVILVPHVPPTAEMEVAELRRAMKTPVESWPVRMEGAVTRFDSLVLQSMLSHPLLVLSAGWRAPDSRAPALLCAEMLPSVARDGDVIAGHIEICNTGDTIWLAETDDGTGTVWLGLQLLSPDGRMLNRELWRTRLAAPVAPGETCRVRVRASLPDALGAYRVKMDLVAERVCWFEDRGSRPAYVDV
jgi:SAM-dependent methyltransferase